MIAPLLASISYLYATWQINRRLDVDNLGDNARVKRMPIFIAMASAFVSHLFDISQNFNGFVHNVSVTNILTLVALCMTLLGAARFVWRQDRTAYPVVALIAAVCVWSPIVLPAPATIAQGWALKVHIVLSIAAYIALGFAALYACFLLLQDYRLRHGRGGFNIDVPLFDIERTMISFTRFGAVLLTLSLATGIVFIHDIWAQHVGHKLFFGVISWVIILIVLLLHHLYGFRGRPVALWLLGGFACLVLSYFGSALVLQIILRS